MALIPCPECGRMVSQKATKCPNCGHELNSIQSQTPNEQKCPECGTIYKMSLKSCPNCGEPNALMNESDNQKNTMNGNKSTTKWIITAIVIAVIVIVFVMIKSCSERREAEQCKIAQEKARIEAQQRIEKEQRMEAQRIAEEERRILEEERNRTTEVEIYIRAIARHNHTDVLETRGCSGKALPYEGGMFEGAVVTDQIVVPYGKMWVSKTISHHNADPQIIYGDRRNGGGWYEDLPRGTITIRGGQTFKLKIEPSPLNHEAELRIVFTETKDY